MDFANEQPKTRGEVLVRLPRVWFDNYRNGYLAASIPARWTRRRLPRQRFDTSWPMNSALHHLPRDLDQTKPQRQLFPDIRKLLRMLNNKWETHRWKSFFLMYEQISRTYLDIKYKILSSRDIEYKNFYPNKARIRKGNEER